MNRSYSFAIIFFIFFFFFISVLARADDDRDFLDCKVNFSCGSLVNLSYPFWGDGRPEKCGHPMFKLGCLRNENTTIRVLQREYQVLRINTSSYEITISSSRERCPSRFESETFLYPFYYSSTVRNLTLFYNCTSNPLSLLSHYHFVCPIGEIERDAYYANDMMLAGVEFDVTTCNIVKVPVEEEIIGGLMESGVGELDEALKEPFGVNYLTYFACDDCVSSGGNCGTELSNSWPIPQSICFCRDGHHGRSCDDEKDRSRWRLKAGIGVGAASVSVVIMCTIFLFYLRHIRKRNSSICLLSQNISSYHSSVRDHGKGDKFLGVQTFSSLELEQATDNFDKAKKLGDGGFGTVYKGELRDGRVVAVKHLDENNCKGVEQFMNEVEILAHLRHPHLVALYGCTSRHSRELLLVYEYVPNGTVADHLHGEHPKRAVLPWPIRSKIAIETATALAYLHANDVIHRDVKTNNILLDNSFNVKVADFGLSRLFPTDVTHVSTAPQGTPGYVDPEYHQCYQLTSKSDVFSFGVVLIELISSLPAVDFTRHRKEINLSNMAINKIQNRALHELVDSSLGFEAESLVRKMITAVADLAFQCLQGSKEKRPSMVEVLESLKSIQSDVYGSKKAEEMDITADDEVC